MADRVYTGDTALIEAFLYDEDGATPLSVVSADVEVKLPDGTIESDTLGVSTSEIEAAWNLTNQVGLYQGRVRFELTNGALKSVPFTFEVIDPFQTTTEATTPIEIAIDRAWMKLEDLFDSELGGPWLRDKTKNEFDREKIQRFVPDALYTIGATYQPVVMYDETNFPFDAHTPLLSQALLVEAIHHLIRSYVEQPQPVGGGNITYFERRDYLNRWQSVLEMEDKKLIGWIDLFKKEQMGYGSTATLLGGYSNVYGRSPRYMRGRYPYVHIRW